MATSLSFLEMKFAEWQRIPSIIFCFSSAFMCVTRIIYCCSCSFSTNFTKVWTFCILLFLCTTSSAELALEPSSGPTSGDLFDLPLLGISTGEGKSSNQSLRKLFISLASIGGFIFICALMYKIRARILVHIVNKRERELERIARENLLDSFPTHSYSLDSEAEQPTECAICLDKYSEGEIIQQLPHCNHVFHMVCIRRWWSNGVPLKCPSCRCDHTKWRPQ